MFRGESKDKMNIIQYLNSQKTIAEHVHENTELININIADLTEIIDIRYKCLHVIMNNFQYLPSHIKEKTFNLFHVSFLLINNFKNTDEVYKYDDEIVNELKENYYDVFLLTSILITSKYSLSKSHYEMLRNKLIFDFNLNIKSLLLCEILILDSLNSNLWVISPSEIISNIFLYFDFKEFLFGENIKEDVENYINYALSEYRIYGCNNLLIISLAICRLILIVEMNDMYLIKFDYFMSENFLTIFMDVKKCSQSIHNLLNADSDNETE